jgi:general secretion pathway protein E/type IV pilus assembly protein PilB
LIDIGVKPFLVSTALRGVMAQRLVRKVCPKCRVSHPPTATELLSLGLTLTPAQIAAANFMKGSGCPECHSTGYRGRMGIFELFVVNDEIQRMIYEQASSTRLRDKARALGMRTMREDGATIEEVASITVGDVS